MPYTKTVWTTSTPINTTNLQKMENGIEAAQAEAEGKLDLVDGGAVSGSVEFNDAIFNDNVDFYGDGHFLANAIVDGNLQVGGLPMHFTQYKTTRSGKDANGVFTIVELRRKSDNTLAVKSTLSLGTSPNYTRRTVQYYNSTGSVVLKTDTFTISYDAAGDWISEV